MRPWNPSRPPTKIRSCFICASRIRPCCGISPVQAWDRTRGSGTDVAQHPVGTGPFRFVSAEQDEEIVLERNSDYFRARLRQENRNEYFRLLLTGARVMECAARKRRRKHSTAALPNRAGRGSASARTAKRLRRFGGVNSLTPDMVVTLAKDPGIVADEQPGRS